MLSHVRILRGKINTFWYFISLKFAANIFGNGFKLKIYAVICDNFYLKGDCLIGATEIYLK